MKPVAVSHYLHRYRSSHRPGIIPGVCVKLHRISLKKAGVLISPSLLDWWYFDAVSASSNASVTVVFYNGGPNGFLNTYQGGPLDVTISGTFTNGTPFGLDESVASSAVVQYTSGAIAADWTGSGFSFAGSSLSLGGLWTVSINAPSIGLTGVITLRSVSDSRQDAILLPFPRHYLPPFPSISTIPSTDKRSTTGGSSTLSMWP